MMNWWIILSVWLLTLGFGVCREIECIPSERETLMKLKHHLTDPSNRISSWNNNNANCCHWRGVVCNNVTAHVLELHLNTSQPDINDYIYYDYMFDQEAYEKAYEAYLRSQIGGEINPCLADMKHLNYLDLSGNNFEGTPIPAFLWTMTSLTHLNLSDSGFEGKIPPQIGNLSNLMYLDLSYAAYGTIPSQIGNLSNLLYLNLRSYPYGSLFAENVDWLSSLSNLEYLDLGAANLSKSFHWLQTVRSLPSLKHLYLSDCILPLSHYTQPSALNFTSLLTLDMSSHFIYPVVSFVPKWVFGLTKLVSLQLRCNNIQGPIPEGIQNLTLLQNLDLFSNSFSSSIPNGLYSLRHLKFLNLQRNNLNGSISNALGNLTSLVRLDLSNNQLEGKLPTSLGNLCNLREIDSSYLTLNQQVNEILQILAPCISHGLTTLRLQSSQLSGNLIDEIGVFKNIVRLDFSNNSIGGSLPRLFGKVSPLRHLDLSRNHFTGNPFESLKSLSKLSYLEIRDNHFEGVVKEDDLSNLTSLKMFSSKGNNFTLKVGPNWHPSFQLAYLDMSSWQLGPNFPSWIQSQNKLHYLDMSNARILDTFPSWFWGTFSQAIYVNFSHNHIYSKLVTTLRNPLSTKIVDLSTNHLCGKLPYLSMNVEWLDISSNSFSGPMNDFLCNKQFKQFGLKLLNLASNNLSGKIPDCWIKWPNLMDVNLQSNNFVGNLPPSMGSLAMLQSCNIRNNSLSGIFPIFLKNYNQLISLDLGENNYSGKIPTWIGERLLNIKILRLRSNNFSGHIPNEICDMIFLRDLDLAQNSLSGNIPSCFNHISAMFQKNKSTDLFIHTDVQSYTGSSAISIFLGIKGSVLEYKSILGLVTNIDLSNNNLSGGIPREITYLDGLIYLNLSNNQLTGQIPPSVGNMRSLESMDISKNQLSGEIPPTIANLSFLNELDVSYNHLKGQIPTGTQIQSFEASYFVGNFLCGPPLTVNCSSNKQISGVKRIRTEDDGHEVNWFFVSMTLGFVVGFCVVVTPLFIYKSWRYVYFCFLDGMWYKMQSYW